MPGNNQTNLGRIAIVWKGQYAELTVYKYLDILVYNNKVYMCKLTAPVGTLPTNGAYFDLLIDPASFTALQIPFSAAGITATDTQNAIIEVKNDIATAIASAVAGLVDSSPATLDTLKEIATALNNDPNFATTMTNMLASKLDVANITAAPSVTPSDTDFAPWIVGGELKRLTWANIKTTLNTYFATIFAPLASPTFTTKITTPSVENGAGSVNFPVAPTYNGVKPFGFNQNYTLWTPTSGTIYYNTSGRAIEIGIYIYGGIISSVQVNGVTIGGINDVTSVGIWSTFKVPDGASYQINISNPGTLSIYTKYS